jgi:type VI secretion system protein ImpA
MSPVLDIDSLVAPLTGPDSVGKRLAQFAIAKDELDRSKLKSMREEIDSEAEKAKAEQEAEQISDAKERTNYLKIRMGQLPPSKRAEWAGILKSGANYLQGLGKDLQVATAMVEAATVQHGFVGLRDGIVLLHRLTTDCWDQLHPLIENETDADDVELRVNWYAWLDQSDSIPFFPETVRKIAVIRGKGGKAVSVAALREPAPGASDDPATLVSELEFEEACQLATADDLHRLRETDETITATLAELDALISDIDARIHEDVRGRYSAPSMSNLRNALEEGQRLVRRILAKRSEATEATGFDEANAASSTATGSGGVSSANVAGGAIRSREDIYKRLVELANALESIDPHSPVPDVIRRAAELRDLRFPELVDKLTSSQPIVEFIRNPIAPAEPAS